MENSDKNEHLKDDPLQNNEVINETPIGESNDNLEKKGNKVADPNPQKVSSQEKTSGSGDEDEEIKQPDSLAIPPPIAKSSENNSIKEKDSEPESTEKADLIDEKASSSETHDEPEHADDTIEKEKIKKTRSSKKTDLSESAPENKTNEAEVVNYELLSKSDLVKSFEDLLNNTVFEQLRYDAEDIQVEYQKKYDEEISEKKQKFLLDGGSEQDFMPVEDPSDKLMIELQEKFKSLKSDFNKQLEETKEINLLKKQEILEEFRLLMEGQESFENTFRKFKQLQKRWFDAGIVPKQNVKDLWNSYNYFVDKFNDHVKINRELRAMDLKKNLELKTALCEKTEALASEANIATAFKILQKYHAQWREIGPVPREDKDVLWERFKEATSVINKAHQNFQSEMKDSLVVNLELKVKLCEKVEEISSNDFSNHSAWATKTNEILAIQKEWKTIGYAPKKDNNKIYARFRKACDSFFEKKAAFYSETFEHQKENLEIKKKIVADAKAMMDSTDWKNTTDKLIELQKRWKEVGPVPQKESDRLWKQFRSACDQFFSNKSDFFGGKDESYVENLKAKEALIKEMRAFVPGTKKNEVIAAMEDFQNRYNEIGFVPVEVKDKIREEFQAVQNLIIDKLNTKDSEKSLIRFRIRISSLINSPKSENKLRFERDKLMNKLQQLKNDIGVWENNIGFFKQTESAEGTISDFNTKIEEAKERIENYEAKIRIIDELEDNI